MASDIDVSEFKISLKMCKIYRIKVTLFKVVSRQQTQPKVSSHVHV